jgi:hypothetical protein
MQCLSAGKWSGEPEREYLAGNGKGKYSWLACHTPATTI